MTVIFSGCFPQRSHLLIKSDYMSQEKRVNAAHIRAREILKFSPLVTDAYFHYTPSQIMLAALSLADRGLVERLLQETFHHPPPPAPAATDSGASTPAANKGSSSSVVDRENQLRGADMRNKVMGIVESCREMLATEPPERMTEFWGTVSSPLLLSREPHTPGGFKSYAETDLTDMWWAAARVEQHHQAPPQET